MLRFAWKFLLAFTLGLGLGFCSPLTPLSADDRGDFLPYLPTTAQKEVMNRSYGVYHIDGTLKSLSSFSGAVAQCYFELERLTHIPWYEDIAIGASSYDLLFRGPENWSYGSGVAGVAYFTNYPAFIDINWRLPYASWDSTSCHEAGHIDGQEDLYTHPLTCKYVTYTRMSCGYPYIGKPQAYDRDIVLNVYVPDLPRTAGVSVADGFLFISYDGVRQSYAGCSPFAGTAFAPQGNPNSEKDNYCGHFSPFLDNVTRVAFFYRDPGGDWVWVGPWYGSPAPSGGAASRGFAIGDWCAPGREWGVHPENALATTWPTFAGGIGFLSGDVKSAGLCP